MGNPLTKAVGNVLTKLMGNVLTEQVGKVLDIYRVKFVNRVLRGEKRLEDERPDFYRGAGSEEA